MKAVLYERWGDPSEVLHVGEVPAPRPRRGQVRVRMLASPINPADLLMVRGEYGKLARLPATPGFEGVGVVEEGSGLLAWRVRGKRVAVLNAVGGNWAEQVVIPARQAVPVPDGIPDEQAATFFVNPASAVVMTRYVLKIPAGGCLVQTAAASALGKMVVRLGKWHGFRTLNVVRRAEQAEELRRLGATDVIVSDGEGIPEQVRSLTGGEGARFAIDAVGGPAGTALVQALAPGGRMLCYGTLSGQPIQVDPRILMVGQKKIEGFWLSEWARGQGTLRMLGLFRQIGRLMVAGVVTTESVLSFPLDEVQAAVRQASAPGKPGKVLLRIGAR
jgi:NADPH:quinone reductase-like Zn-dependent oxidoreductase